MDAKPQASTLPRSEEFPHGRILYDRNTRPTLRQNAAAWATEEDLCNCRPSNCEPWWPRR
jgi:hypothetical protein